jgi:4-hydroxybenzoate polyprenyltransferase
VDSSPLVAEPALPALPAVLRAVRLHQWSKNVLVFLPLLAAHRVWDGTAWARAGLAFLAFSLVASSVYVLNDALDVASDRRHALKRTRPFAAGALPLSAAFVLVPGLLAGGGAVALLLPPGFAAALAGYWVTTCAYSLALRRVAILDVMALAGLYTARIYAGAFAVGVPVSEWLASFSFFFFLSLAIVKRASEIGKDTEAPSGRGYRPGDHLVVSAMGVTSGNVSVLVLALYVNSPEVRHLYSHPARLWGLCVLAAYWISRVWLLAWRGDVHDDPVVFAVRDPVTWAVAALGGAVIWLGT